MKQINRKFLVNDFNWERTKSATGISTNILGNLKI